MQDGRTLSDYNIQKDSCWLWQTTAGLGVVFIRSLPCTWCCACVVAIAKSLVASWLKPRTPCLLHFVFKVSLMTPSWLPT